ncbi:hypothetical protein [Stygiolobus caldivivus]|uniref:Thioredoxin domain-containing protein n=1 Tax=Stygiolobus caldivivus TaxID=2824673 RepID=A0A8D5ZKF3_9CREN|nr:hypothetical protein [Stygiolobus caldivivus]BCU71325.1 hypothetical protein KN1_26220 [Stygiolobus caldivivus]
MKAKKLILVTSESHPSHKAFVKVTEDLSTQLNLEKEIKIEDYTFLTDYGEKDEFGMPFLPQLFVQTDDGKIVPVLTQMPFNQKFQPDPEKGKEEAINKIKNIT